MKRPPRLWQQVFFYCLVSVLVSQVLISAVHYAGMKQRTQDIALSMFTDASGLFANQTIRSVEPVLNLLNKRHNRIWLEDTAGGKVAGERYNGLSRKDLGSSLELRDKRDDIVIWGIRGGNPELLLEMPVVMDSRELKLYYTFNLPPRPPYAVIIIQNVLLVLLVGGILSFWVASRVSRPLRRLQGEVLEMTGARSLEKVSVSGSGEIADVAQAINYLVDNLKRHTAAMRQFIMTVSHELRSPLARMGLSAVIIEDGIRNPQAHQPSDANGADAQDRETALKHARILQEELEHMDQLINKILLSNKLELIEPGTLRQQVGLSSLCEKAAERYSRVFEEAGLLFRAEVEPGLKVRGDGTLLMQLLTNLLDNAVKHTSGVSADVVMTLCGRNGKAMLTVENGHDPVSEEDLNSMFEPLVRLSSRAESGFGIGLSMVHRIVTLHTGELMAVNTDAGLCVCVQLPLHG
ncbi:HAMP domain-containing histidine kinase [Desulfovibrio sp. OttesenSCG-928-G15]|nr:HAMP domain-containing histidine kinase [Desulfovibrio sp. OttesenSCG-928-G15]